MIMIAMVTQVHPEYLFVTDLSTRQEVLVHFINSERFSVDDIIEITYNGMMTSSLPPQITADFIRLIRPAQPPAPPEITPAQMRAIVLLRGRGFLIVHDIRNNRRLRVDYANAHLFRPGQRVVIFYDTITMGNPPVITAVDIRPV